HLLAQTDHGRVRDPRVGLLLTRELRRNARNVALRALDRHPGLQPAIYSQVMIATLSQLIWTKRDRDPDIRPPGKCEAAWHDPDNLVGFRPAGSRVRSLSGRPRSAVATGRSSAR